MTSQAISLFNAIGPIRPAAQFSRIQPPVGFFYHVPDDPQFTRIGVKSDQDLIQFVSVHQSQPLLMFRGSTAPDKPTPPSSPDRAPPNPLSFSSSRDSIQKRKKELVYFRDLGRCCFTGETLVLPAIPGSPPNLQILHLFPAATSYDPEEKELKLLPIESRHDIRNIFLGKTEFNGWLDSGAVRVSPDYVIHICDPEIMKQWGHLDGKRLLLPTDISRDTSGNPVRCTNLSPDQLKTNIHKFPPPEMFDWHYNFIERTQILPRQLRALEIDAACCPECNAKCKTIKCSCWKEGKYCNECASKSCRNKPGIDNASAAVSSSSSTLSSDPVADDDDDDADADADEQ